MNFDDELNQQLQQSALTDAQKLEVAQIIDRSINGSNVQFSDDDERRLLELQRVAPVEIRKLIDMLADLEDESE